MGAGMVPAGHPDSARRQHESEGHGRTLGEILATVHCNLGICRAAATVVAGPGSEETRVMRWEMLPKRPSVWFEGVAEDL